MTLSEQNDSKTFQAAIDEQIRLLSELKRFASNPAALELMRKFTSPASPPTPLLQTETPNAVNGQRKTRSKSHYQQGNLYGAVERAMHNFPSPQFDIRELVDHMEEGGYHFVAKNPRVAVWSIMQKMVKEGKATRMARTDSSATVADRYERVLP